MHKHTKQEGGEKCNSLSISFSLSLGENVEDGTALFSVYNVSIDINLLLVFLSFSRIHFDTFVVISSGMFSSASISLPCL